MSAPLPQGSISSLKTRVRPAAGKSLVSLYDYSGQWAAPFEDFGASVTCMDIKTDEAMDVLKYGHEYLIENFGLDIIDGVLLAPPCTDFTNAGAQYWKRKDRDGTTKRALAIVYAGLATVEWARPDFWALENPVGRLAQLVPEIGEARLTFDPCDFAGYVWETLTSDERAHLDEIRAKSAARRWDDITAADVELVKRSNLYTKRTQIWGEFNLPEKRRLEPIKVCAQGSWTQKLGGKSESTKEQRSDTPAGFAMAFAMANDWSEEAIAGWGGTAADKIEAGEEMSTLRRAFYGDDDETPTEGQLQLFG